MVPRVIGETASLVSVTPKFNLNQLILNREQEKLYRIRHLAVRESGVSWHREGLIEDPLNITTLWYREVSGRESSVSVTPKFNLEQLILALVLLTSLLIRSVKYALVKSIEIRLWLPFSD